MPPVAPLTGRDSELQIARNSLMAAAVGRGSLLLVSGPAGIGKTRFLEAVADDAKGRGFSTGVGVAFEPT